MALIEIEDRYKNYLASPKWRWIAEEIKQRDNMMCQVCKSTKNLQVHHITKRWRYHEEKHPETLVTLCNVCHERIHRYWLVVDGLKEHAQNQRLRGY